jgi:EAL domain-containing protein (putative c-di-GMP-specific phosphodiesterase class I)
MQWLEWRHLLGEDGGAPDSMWVNLSVRQFASGELARELGDVLRELRFDPRRLTLEVTEGLMSDSLDLALRTLSELRGLGAKIFVDDFGTGYSSLGYLDRLALDGIKVDRSFVGQMDTGERPLQLVRSLVSLIRSLGLVAVAEGVETT